VADLEQAAADVAGKDCKGACAGSLRLAQEVKGSHRFSPGSRNAPQTGSGLRWGLQ
jgi:hypothetical protein